MKTIYGAQAKASGIVSVEKSERVVKTSEGTLGGQPIKTPPCAPSFSSQRKLVLNDPPRCVLSTIASARQLLPGHDEDDILALIEEGRLLAWDISLRPGTTAKEIRILPQTVEFFSRTGGTRGKHGFGNTWPSIILNGDDKPFLFAPRIALILNCGATHVTNLIDTGAMAQLAGTEYRRGPNGAACIQRMSFLHFLKAREL